ncbi:MAG: YfhO family protein [candidate division Zixibacteria bacterium]|nr:YfhO family protein [candidate division Zixibacteria bacterium]MDH3936816.1 YfhO family protein [candidate division Zixibacteria bacterium]MDH4033891.1 YfhO family protein [candidate division Zixibacteria bacterium]
MAKKKRTKQPTQRVTSRSFDIENSPWFAPIAFGVIFIALLVLFGGFIFSDKMLFGSDTIQAGIFFRSYLVDHVAEHGSVPQWNPYIFCGMPYVEAFHGDIFYPLSALKFVGSIYRMLGLNLVIHIFLAGLFMYLTARRFRLSKVAALMSAVCYMFAGYLISFVAPGHDGKIFVTTLFPLVILFLELGFNNRGLKQFFMFSTLGMVLGVIILSPHPQMSYFTLWVVAFYALFRLIVMLRDKQALLSVLRPASLTAYAVVVGLLLSAIQFYPGYLYTSEFSPRADSKAGWEWATSWSMHEEEAMSLLIPEFAGTSSQNTRTAYWGKNYFKDNSEAVGVVTIFVAMIGLLFYRRKESWFFGGLAIFALVYALGATTPLFKLFYYLIPKVKALRAPSMIMFIFSFSAALLAGMGLEWLRDSRNRSSESKPFFNFNYWLLGLPALMLLLALIFSAGGKGALSAWCSVFYEDAPRQMVNQNMSKLDLAYVNLPAIQSGAWLAFLFSALASGAIWLFRSGRAGAGVLLVVVGVSVVDGVRFNQRFVDTVDPNQHWGPNPVADYLKNQPDHYRVMNFKAMPEDMLPYYGVEVVTGYHGNQLRWFDELLGGPGAKNQINPRLLNLSSAGYIVAPANQQMPDGYFGDKPVTAAAIFGSVQLYRNNNALPRVFLSDKYRLFDDRKEIYPLILQGSENLQDIVYLEKEPSLSITEDSTLADSAWIIDYQTDSVTVGVSCAANQLLVLTDNYFDAWHVSIDGKPTELLRSYGTFRAVALPAGTEQVQFWYNSERYATGKMMTTSTLIYLLLVSAAYFLFRRRKGQTKEEPLS